MTYEAIQSPTKEEKTKPEEIEIISEQNWDKKNIPIIKSVFKIEFFAILIFLTFVLIAVIFGISLVFKGSTNILLSSIVFIGFVFISLLFFLSYLSNTKIEYQAESGKIYKLDQNLLGGLQGKIVVKRGLIGKSTTNLTMTEFDSIDVSQGILGKLLNYGTVILEKVDKTQDTPRVYLPYVKNPHKIGPMIQRMIDLAKRKTTLPAAIVSPESVRG